MTVIGMQIVLTVLSQPQIMVPWANDAQFTSRRWCTGSSPCSAPSPCNCKQGCSGTWRQRQRRSARGSGVHGAGTECLDRSPSIDSQLTHVNFSLALAPGRENNVPAPPAIVPSRYGLISMTFLTVPDAKALNELLKGPESVYLSTYQCSCLLLLGNPRQRSHHLGSGKQGLWYHAES